MDLETIIEKQLEKILPLKINDDLSRSHPVNNSKEIIRSVLRPLLMYLNERGFEIVNLNFPGEVITKVAHDQAAHLDLNLVSQLEEYNTKENRDWVLEATVMSIELDNHPLFKLRNQITGRLSQASIKALTRKGAES